MKVRNPVSDDAMRSALNNSEYRAIIWSVLRRYRTQIPSYELEDAISDILYRTLGSHQDGRGRKFTTSLVTFTQWYVSNLLYEKRKRRRRFEMAIETRRDSCESVVPDRMLEVHDELNDILRNVPDGYREILLDYYVGGYTLKMLAGKYGCPEDCVQRRLGNALHVARQAAQFRYNAVESETETLEEDESW